MRCFSCRAFEIDIGSRIHEPASGPLDEPGAGRVHAIDAPQVERAWQTAPLLSALDTGGLGSLARRAIQEPSSAARRFRPTNVYPYLPVERTRMRASLGDRRHHRTVGCADILGRALFHNTDPDDPLALSRIRALAQRIGADLRNKSGSRPSGQDGNDARAIPRSKARAISRAMGPERLFGLALSLIPVPW